MTYPRWLRPALTVPSAVSLISLILFLKTSAPGITFGDAGDFASAAYTLGIPHPPGYPLFTILAYILIKAIPFGEPVWRAGLLSSIPAAAAIGLFCLIGRRLTDSWPAAFLGSLAIATALSFWSRASFIETYSLHLFFVALTILLLLKWERDPKSTRSFCLLTGALGLSLTNHPTMLLLLPGIAFFIYDTRASLNIKQLLNGFAAFMAPLLLYAYLPLRAMAHPLKNWGDPSTLARWLDHVLVAQYSSSLLHLPSDIYLERLAAIPQQLHLQYSTPLAILGVIGLFSLFQKQTKRALALLLIFLTVVLLFARNTAGDSVIFEDNFMTAYAIWGIFVIVGSARLLDLAAHVRPVLSLSVFIFILSMLVVTSSAHLKQVDMSENRMAQRLTDDLLSELPRRSLILTNSDNYLAPMEYAQIVHHRRPDITIVAFSEVSMEWYRHQLTNADVRLPKKYLKASHDELLLQLIANNRHRPIFLTTPYDSVLKKYQLQPAGQLLRLTDEKTPALPRLPELMAVKPAELADEDTREILAEPLLHLALLHMNRGDNKTALPLLQRGLDIAPEDIRFYAALSVAYINAKDLKSALAIIEKSKRVDRAFPYIYSHSAMIAEAMHDHRSAYVSARKALALNPHDAESMLFLAINDFETDQFEEALKRSQQVLAESPCDYRAYMLIANSAERTGDYKLAVRSWAQVSRLSSDPDIKRQAASHIKIYTP